MVRQPEVEVWGASAEELRGMPFGDTETDGDVGDVVKVEISRSAEDGHF